MVYFRLLYREFRSNQTSLTDFWTLLDMGLEVSERIRLEWPRIDRIGPAVNSNKYSRVVELIFAGTGYLAWVPACAGTTLQVNRRSWPGAGVP